MRERYPLVMLLALVTILFIMPGVITSPVMNQGLQPTDTTEPFPPEQFFTSVTDTVDTNSNSIYGSVSNFVNMQDTGDSDYATLVETDEGSSFWSTIYTEEFEDSSLSGWYVDGWTRTDRPSTFSNPIEPNGFNDGSTEPTEDPGSYCYWSTYGNGDAYLTYTMYMTTTVSTSGASQIRVYFDLKTDIDRSDVYFNMFFKDNAGNWDNMYTRSSTTGWTTITETSTDSQYIHNNFAIKFTFYWKFSDALPLCAAYVDHLVIQKYNYNPNYRLQQEFQFTGVDYSTFSDENLVVDVYSASSENLVVRCYDGSSWVTLGTISSNTKYFFDISSFLTSSTFTIALVDASTSGDSSQSTWEIDAIYLDLSDAIPYNSGDPTVDSKYNDNLLARKSNNPGDFVYITTQHVDPDGYSDIETCTLEGMIGTSSIWKVQYSENTDTFTIVSGDSYIDIEPGDCSKSGTTLTITWHVRIDWAHPETTSMDFRYTVSDSSSTDTDTYSANLGVITTLELSSESLDDNVGLSNRGDPSGSITASGRVYYSGTAYAPETSQVDVWILATLNSGDQTWEATLNSDGTFSTNVDANSIVALTTYTFKVVSQGAGADAAALDSGTFDYITDRIICVDISSPQNIVDASATGTVQVRLQYEYDGTGVLDGTYTINGYSLTHISGDLWYVDVTPGTRESIVFSVLEITSDNRYGVTGLDINGKSVAMFWEVVDVYISAPFNDPIYVGENASGISAWGVYSYHASHGNVYYDGTLHLNNTQFSYDTVGTRGYRVSSIDGDDAFGIITIRFHNETSCTWIYPPPEWTTLPTDMTVELGTIFEYALSAEAMGGIDSWWLNDTTHFSISSIGVVSNVSFLEIGVYGIQVWLNNTQNDIITATFKVIVQDTLSPMWTEIPEDQYIESMIGLSYQLHAFDFSGIDSWWIDNTVHFAINKTGFLTNATHLTLGTYEVTVFVNDTLGHVTSVVLNIYVLDKTLPFWVEEPSDQFVEFGENLYYLLHAEAELGITSWSVDDSSHFTIDEYGLVTSIYTLPVGEYPVTVTVTDSLNRTLIGTFTVYVQDTTPPSWDEIPQDISVEFGTAISLRFSANDLSGVLCWSVDDTTRFVITNRGWLLNRTPLTTGSYSVNVSVYDIYGNCESIVITITVTPAMAPQWDFMPVDQSLELGDDFSYQLSCHDDSGIGAWGVNDTIHFTIDENGLIENKVALSVGTYTLQVWVTDIYGNTNTTIFKVTVADTTPPMWTEAPPRTVIVMEGSPVGIALHASDLSLPLTWRINDTENFVINGTGFIMNRVQLASGTYWLHVNVTDAYGNTNYVELSVIVLPNQYERLPAQPISIVVVLGGLLGIVIVVLIVFKLPDILSRTTPSSGGL